jgi:hypothetical protein
MGRNDHFPATHAVPRVRPGRGACQEAEPGIWLDVIGASAPRGATRVAQADVRITWAETLPSNTLREGPPAAADVSRHLPRPEGVCQLATCPRDAMRRCAHRLPRGSWDPR